MFEYFKDNYAWNLTAVTLIEEIGTISQPAEAFEAVVDLADGPPEKANQAWYDVMTELGGRLERLAEEDLANGNPLTASRKFHRAAMYFVRADRIASPHDPRRLVAYKRMLQNYRKAREHGQDGVEFVNIPYKDGAMPAILVPAKGDGKAAPIVIHIQGFDSIKETQFPMFQEYRRRGLSCLIVDQPGAGGALRLHGLTGCSDTEAYVSCIVDWIINRADLAADRIGLCGISMGGYFAPRAAAFEPRIKACAAWGAMYDAYPLVMPHTKGEEVDAPSVPNSMEHALWTFGLDKPEDFISFAKEITLKGVVGKIKCPLLVTHGENDRQVPLEQAVQTYEEATTPDKTLKIFTQEEGGVEHCQIDNRAIAADYVSDWFAAKL